MLRAYALLGLSFAAFACDGSFAFDTESSGGAGSGGAGSGGVGGVGGTAGSSAGSGGALDCEARCQSVQLTCLQSQQLCVECVKDDDCRARGGLRCGVAGQTSNRCLGCLIEDDCAQGELCELGTHTCVTRCTRFGDPICLASGLDCNLRRLYCAACFDADDCDEVRLRCSVGDARCVQCVDDDECASQPGKWCDPVTLSCVVCRDSLDCNSSKETCDPVAHTCR